MIHPRTSSAFITKKNPKRSPPECPALFGEVDCIRYTIAGVGFHFLLYWNPNPEDRAEMMWFHQYSLAVFTRPESSLFLIYQLH
jgi:hypothetical protein